LSTPLVPTGKTVDLVNFLSEKLAPLMSTATFRVMEWFNPAHMIKWLLENKTFNIIISVKRAGSTTSRTYNGTPLSDLVVFQIEVWLNDAPAFNITDGRALRSEIRDQFVEAIQSLFKQYPVFGTEKSTKNADFTKHNQFVLNTIITVAQLKE